MRKTFITLAIAVLAMMATKVSAVSATVFEDNYADYCVKNIESGKTATLTYTKSELTLGKTELYSITYNDAINSNVLVQSTKSGWSLRYAGVLYIGLQNGDGGRFLAIANCKAGDKIEIALNSAKAPTDPVNATIAESTSTWTFSFTSSDSKSRTLGYTVYTATVTQDGIAGFKLEQGLYIGKITVTRDVSSTTLSAGGNGYTTFSSTSNFTVTGATAYYVKQGDASSSSVALTEITSGSVIPASQGVILKADNSGDEITVNYTTDDATALDNNLLKPVLTTTQAFESTGTNYVLATTTGGETAFYKTTNANATWTSLQGKCYLNIPSSTNSAKLNISFGGTTGINKVQNSNINFQSGCYNLAGQRVGSNCKGIIIVNGKKYIKK